MFGTDSSWKLNLWNAVVLRSIMSSESSRVCVWEQLTECVSLATISVRSSQRPWLTHVPLVASWSVSMGAAHLYHCQTVYLSVCWLVHSCICSCRVRGALLQQLTLQKYSDTNEIPIKEWEHVVSGLLKLISCPAPGLPTGLLSPRVAAFDRCTFPLISSKKESNCFLYCCGLIVDEVAEFAKKLLRWMSSRQTACNVVMFSDHCTSLNLIPGLNCHCSVTAASWLHRSRSHSNSKAACEPSHCVIKTSFHTSRVANQLFCGRL